MIAFTRLGQYGRLGNQLFQYAFLRETARRLGVPFHCPTWEGDDIFDLGDADLRLPQPEGLTQHFGPIAEAGFCESALLVTDHTDIEGFFQSERYYADKAEVRRWYRFRRDVVEAVASKFDVMLAANSVSVSLRIDGDYANTREFFPLYPLAYYRRAYARLAEARPVLVFADRPDLARQFFSPWRDVDLHFVEGLSGAEQLCLMTHCRANIITNSTFAWWGAWLNSHAEARVYCPDSWCRPGVPRPIRDILSTEWQPVPATLPVWDHFQTWRLRHPVTTAQRVLRRLWPESVTQ